eukprot:SAG25_NODE_8527_length_417_cov_1.141509_1_plen_112_part_01
MFATGLDRATCRSECAFLPSCPGWRHGKCGAFPEHKCEDEGLHQADIHSSGGLHRTACSVRVTQGPYQCTHSDTVKKGDLVNMVSGSDCSLLIEMDSGPILSTETRRQLNLG